MLSKRPKQVELDLVLEPSLSKGNGTVFVDPAFATNKSLPIHRWVPWIAGFSKDFVNGVLNWTLHISMIAFWAWQQHWEIEHSTFRYLQDCPIFEKSVSF